MPVADAPALLFPGQGSQTPTMREEASRLRPDLLELVCELVGEDPFARVGDGTRFAQPALLCASLARSSSYAGPAPAVLLGHSLGELGALAAAGALTETDALRLAVRRGALMDRAGERAGSGGMLAVLGGEPDQVGAIAERHGLAVANDNAPGQAVLSGDAGRLRAASADARSAGLRTMRLPVAGAFHSPAMREAVPDFRQLLEATAVRAPQVPVVSGVTALPFDDVRRRLAEALTAPVRFREALLRVRRGGVQRFVEVGPGRVLTGLVRRTLPDSEAVTLDVPEAVGA